MTTLPLRTRELAGVMYWLCMLGQGAIAVSGAILTWSIADLAKARQLAHGMDPELYQPGPLSQAALVAGLWISLAAVAYTIWHMSRLFALYRADSAITAGSARTIRRIGQGFLAQAALGVLNDPAEALILSMDAPPGFRQIAIGFQSSDLGFVLSGGMMLIIGWVITQAVDIQRENEGFV